MSSAMQSTCPMAMLLVCDVCGKSLADHAGADHQFVPRLAYDPSTWKRSVRFAHEGIEGPSEVYLTVEDRLRMNLTNGAPGVEVDISVRILRPDGQITVLKQPLFPPANNAITTTDLDLCEGFLLDVVASTPTVGVRRGQLFADLNLIRGAGVNAFTVRNLVDSYVCTNSASGWPEADNYESVLGEGIVRSIQIGNPAAGAQWTAAVPAGARWEVLALNAQLLTSAVVANRIVTLQITDGVAHVLHNTAFGSVQAASLTFQYSAAEGDPVAFLTPNQTGPLPHSCKLLQGFTVQSAVTAMDVGDQWSAISLLVMQWMEA